MYPDQTVISSVSLSLLLKVCQTLKNRARNVRDIARDTLVKMAAALGPRYLPYIIREMKELLTRGYQVRGRNLGGWEEGWGDLNKLSFSEELLPPLKFSSPSFLLSSTPPSLFSLFLPLPFPLICLLSLLLPTPILLPLLLFPLAPCTGLQPSLGAKWCLHNTQNW